MKTPISVASLLACSLSLDAQIAATLVRLPDRSVEVRVRNSAAVSATAFAVKIDHVSVSAKGDAPLTVYLGPDTVYVDTAMEPAIRPLQPNQEQAIKLQLNSRSGRPTPLGELLSDARKQLERKDRSGRAILHFEAVDLSEHTVTTAGVFADGATSGDSALLNRLMLRRSNMLLAVEMTLETLADAGRRNVPPDQLIGQFKKLVDSARRAYLPPEQRIGVTLYQSMIGKLLNLPDSKDGSPFPPNEFVEQETAALRQQRVALLESQPSLFMSAETSLNSK